MGKGWFEQFEQCRWWTLSHFSATAYVWLFHYAELPDGFKHSFTDGKQWFLDPHVFDV
jgi:hypothetical protein